MTARLYGRMDGWSSHAQVSKGFEAAMRCAGVLAGVYPIDEDVGFDDEPPPGASARHAVFTGPTTMIEQVMRAVSHEFRYGMLAPNSTVVELPTVKAYNGLCTHVLAPSRWATGILGPMFEIPVLTAPHGVHENFKLVPERNHFAERCPPRKGFNVLHLSTSDRERKGTHKLLQAWRRLLDEERLPRKSMLTLLLDNMAARALDAWLDDEEIGLPPRVSITRRLNAGRGAGPEIMRVLYSAFHVVCQPSRGEGFGLTPLEVRACGVPVVATAKCTGHSEHMGHATETDGVMVVPTGGMAPLDDLPGAMAPSLSVDAIADALEGAYLTWPELDVAARGKAQQVRTEWAWQRKLAPLMERLKET